MSTGCIYYYTNSFESKEDKTRSLWCVHCIQSHEKLEVSKWKFAKWFWGFFYLFCVVQDWNIAWFVEWESVRNTTYTVYIATAILIITCLWLLLWIGILQQIFKNGYDLLVTQHFLSRYFFWMMLTPEFGAKTNFDVSLEAGLSHVCFWPAIFELEEWQRNCENWKVTQFQQKLSQYRLRFKLILL